MTLVILAAGMGSRFGGIKQLTPLTENGEFVIDFTVFDAVRAGFDRIVFIIRKEHQEIFEETIGARIRNSGVRVEYVYQRFDLPQGFTFPEGRKKPWGTAQAIMCAGDVGDNFGVVNADDFYGFETFRILADFLKTAKDDEKAHYCSVAYKLKNTLSENGMTDIAYELLFQRKNPSWLYSVDNGATTMWERWNSYMKDKGMGPKGMNSFNHYAYGCVCEWMWKTMAGIASDSAEPGFKHIIMKPVPDRRLGYVRASYKSAAGLIESSWRYEGDKWIWEFSIPKGAKASVSLPDGSPVKEYGEGRHSVELSL